MEIPGQISAEIKRRVNQPTSCVEQTTFRNFAATNWRICSRKSCFRAAGAEIARWRNPRESRENGAPALGGLRLSVHRCIAQFQIAAHCMGFRPTPPKSVKLQRALGVFSVRRAENTQNNVGRFEDVRATKINGIEQALVALRETASQIGMMCSPKRLKWRSHTSQRKKERKLREYPSLVGHGSPRKAG
jgi:hypothetical protein